MTEKEIVRELMKKKGLTYRSLAETLNTKLTNVQSHLDGRRDSMTVSTLAEMLDAMGCDLIIRCGGEDHKVR